MTDILVQLLDLLSTIMLIGAFIINGIFWLIVIIYALIGLVIYARRRL